MQRLLNAMKLQAQLAQQGAHARLGKVLGYDAATYRAKVLIQPENQITGWMPVASEWVGNGWGMFAPPAEGDAVLVEFFHGDFEAGIITRRLYHNAARPQANVAAGEFWLVHQSGSSLKFHNDGSVEISSNKDLTATVKGKATLTANGGIDLVGAQGGSAVGVVQGECLCAFTGAQHPMVSGTIRGSK